MFTVHSLPLAVACCVITMLGWGSWANTQKLAGKTKWPFELFYWDYAIGVFLFSILFMLTLGSSGAAGMGAIENLRQAAQATMLSAALAGALFNISNILLVVAIDGAGMAVAFPVGVGLALVIGTIGSYVQNPKGNPVALTGGVALVVVAMALSAIAYSRLPKVEGPRKFRAIIFAVVAGCLMGFFYPELTSTISPDFNHSPIQPGTLTPYTALFFFAAGMLMSNVVVNTIFMKAGGRTYPQYFAGSVRLHSLGVLGSFAWMLALSLNVLAAGVAGPAVSYALGQGATLVASIWGVLIWREFRAAPPGTSVYIYLMFAAYAAGLIVIGLATV